MDMPTIRTALKAALDSNLTDCQVTDYPRAPTLPSVQVIGNSDIEYGTGGFGRDDDSWLVIVRGMVAEDTDQIRMLDRWVASTGTDSVKYAIESDKTLGGAVQVAIVQRASQPAPGQTADGQGIYFVDFTILIETSD